MYKKYVITGVLIIGLSVSVALYFFKTSEPSKRMSKDEAIRQAQEYRPKNPCLSVLVDAVHTETGAKYTFPSSCLAPGWKTD